MNRLKITGLILVFFCISLELVLRFVWGFCDALLYRADEDYEYIAQPNQYRKRFGALIHYNSFSQRSEEPDSTKIKILGLGDSVLFGGTTIDQDSIATTLFTKETDIQMLNISAGSWGPDNCAAYLHKHGTFGTKAILLVCSSHDAFDVMSHVPVVGIYPTYPEKQYPLAIMELYHRYIMPRMANCFTSISDPDEQIVKNSNITVQKKSATFNSGFDELKSIADSINVPFVIYLHAELSELETGHYNDMGQCIITWAEENKVPLINGITNGEQAYMYRDIIHLNESGQRHLATILEQTFMNK